ncbi:MAG: hypothetical protein KUG77_12760 [Nannocystaceae bacterium]|nr:hypothetical protein [Nannocystaceae bacterium]
MLAATICAYVTALLLAEPSWQAPAGCPTQSEVDQLLREENAGVPAEVIASCSVDAVVSRLDDGAWQVSVLVDTGSAQVRRVLRLDSCEAAAEATALVYGLALGNAVATQDTPPTSPVEPTAFVPPPEASEQEETEGPRTDRPDEPVPSEVGPNAEVSITSVHQPPPRVDTQGRGPFSKPRYRGAALAGVGLSAATLPGVTLAVSAGGDVRLGPLRVGSSLEYAFARQYEVLQGTAAGDLSTLVASLSVGVPLEWKAVWTPSTAVRGGRILGQGRGGDTRRRQWVPWWLLAIGLDASWPPRSRWALRVGASLEVPLVSHTFKFDSAVLTNTAPVGVRAWLGPLIRFGQ